MAKLGLDDDIGWLIINAPAPDEFRKLIIDRLRSGTASDQFANLVADMIDPSSRTHYRLKLERRSSGKPNQSFNYELFQSIEKIIDTFNYGEKVSAEKVLNYDALNGIELRIGKNTKQIDPKTVRRYLKMIAEVQAINRAIDEAEWRERYRASGKQLPE